MRPSGGSRNWRRNSVETARSRDHGGESPAGDTDREGLPRRGSRVRLPPAGCRTRDRCGGWKFDKACLLLNFFQNLRLRKSQADALLNRLSRHWAGEFERLCTLLAHAAVVHADETSWSLHSVWAFLSEKVRVLFFGVHKAAETLAAILDPATFAGIVVSDDAAVYADFTNAQKCWTHLLRKAIQLTLLEPTNVAYRRLTDRLLEIYRAACRGPSAVLDRVLPLPPLPSASNLRVKSTVG